MKLVIIGGGAGGPASASRARRLDEKAEIMMFERGEHISYGHCGLPYFIGGVIKNRSDLLISTPEKFKDLYNVDVRVRSVVKNIMPDTKQIEVVNLNTGDSYSIQYDKMILSTGADPIKPPLPGIDTNGIFTLRNLTDADKINQYVTDQKPKKVVIVGGGFIGLEMAENFRNKGMDVTIVEMLDQVMPPLDREMAEPIHQTLALHGVELILSDAVAGFESREGHLNVKLKSGKEIACDMVMLSIGVKPNLDLAKSAGLTVDRGIKVNEYMQTSNPDIYAVGDGVETIHLVTGESVLVPLAGISARQARIAVDNIYGKNEKYEGTLGTSLVKVFETTVGIVGANEKSLKRLGLKYEKCYVLPFSHVNYYPDSAQMTIKLLFSPDDGRVLGSQIIGTDGIDKRIDTLASAISAGMNVHDLTNLELGYVPQYGSAKEAINAAGYVASNILSGDMPIAHWDKFDELKNGVFLDVSESDVTGIGMVPGAKNIPLLELRDRHNELPKDVPIYVYCSAGLESYIALCMLRQRGFDAINMSGGYSIYKSTCLRNEAVEPIKATIEKPTVAVETSAKNKPEEITYLDACGLQCPGPILKVKQKMDELKPGTIMEITANDTGFAIDLPAWCKSTGNEVESVEVREGKIVGRIRKSEKETSQQTTIQATLPQEKTIVVFSNDMDKVMSAFIIANGSASMGYKVNLFFTFWGLNVLRKSKKVSVAKSLVERMFGWMMPRGVSKLTLSKMNMGGMGTMMMKSVMKQKNVNTLEELVQMAKQQGIRLIACTMTMGIMGLHKEELLDGVEEGGVAAFIGDADRSNMTLFI
ncbi:MAG: hypothetical protein QG641_2061 [Candidatus Poribacteria bacterium]|nr:hypothetical protein [Candidatus Poribacteria bacterium]